MEVENENNKLGKFQIFGGFVCLRRSGYVDLKLQVATSIIA